MIRGLGPGVQGVAETSGEHEQPPGQSRTDAPREERGQHGQGPGVGQQVAGIGVQEKGGHAAPPLPGQDQSGVGAAREMPGRTMERVLAVEPDRKSQKRCDNKQADPGIVRQGIGRGRGRFSSS